VATKEHCRGNKRTLPQQQRALPRQQRTPPRQGSFVNITVTIVRYQQNEENTINRQGNVEAATAAALCSKQKVILFQQSAIDTPATRREGLQTF